MIFKQAQIEKFLKKPDENFRIVVIYGSNEGLVSEYTKQFTQAICNDIYDPFRVTYMSMDQISADRSSLVAEYNAQSLMGGRRVVVVKDADSDLAKSLPMILESRSDTLLVIASTNLKKKSTLVSQAETSEAIICVPCYEDRDESIYSSTRQFLIEEGYTINSEALSMLCARLSNDRKTNLAELQKLLTYVGERKEISLNDIISVVGDVASLNVEDLVYSAISGDTEKSLYAYEKILKEGTEPVSIIRNIYYHLNRLLLCKSYMEEGANISSATAKLKPPLIFYRKGTFENQLQFWKTEKILDAFELLYKAERDCKTTNMPTEAIVSYTIMQICSAAKRQRSSR